MQLKFIFFVIIILISIINNSSLNKQERFEYILDSLKDKPKKIQFKVLHSFFNKQYDLNSEEGIRRYYIFKSNIKEIEEFNSRNLSYKLGLNQFFDLTDNEIKEMYLSNFNLQDISNETNNHTFKTDKSINFDEMADIEDEREGTQKNLYQTLKINWTDYMNPVLNQESCGSCWAFGALGAVEGNYNLKFGKTLPFSEKELLDCNNRNHGCNGGSPNFALDYIIKYGISINWDYPYSFSTLKNNYCRSSLYKRYYPLMSYNKPLALTDTKFFDMLNKGPLIVSIDAYSKDILSSKCVFCGYSKGIMENITCKEANHAVVAIGVDYDDKGPYLIGRNSWGTQWGERGNFRIRINTANKTCFMMSSAILPIVRNINDPAPNPLECMKVYSKANYQGIVEEICENSKIGVNFPILSFKIGKFYEVNFFEDINCSGKIKSYKNDLSSTNIVAKSIVVLGEGNTVAHNNIVAYSDYCRTGDKISSFNDIADLNTLNFGNKISSFDFGKRVSIMVYDSPNYTGSSLILRMAQRNDISLYGSVFDKKILSIKLNYLNIMN